MRILGLVTRTHDSGLALLEDGVPTFVLEEERFNREKHTRKFPFHSLKAAFDDRGLSLAGIDVITTPWHMLSLWRMMFAAVREGFPASLNLERQADPVDAHRHDAEWPAVGLAVAFRRQTEAAEDRASAPSRC
ncbi:MAG: carbamoyltransferase N-terminal domain-containing protein, partial [Methyloceanibacter sp.]